MFYVYFFNSLKISSIFLYMSNKLLINLLNDQFEYICINSYIGNDNICIKKPSGLLMGINLTPTTYQAGAYATQLQLLSGIRY